MLYSAKSLLKTLALVTAGTPFLCFFYGLGSPQSLSLVSYQCPADRGDKNELAGQGEGLAHDLAVHNFVN